ncbi:Conserved_hypothetical protein [Hexamita inflata]|uniref:Uncharacterized protein n=1 Tax=Hexamita inflata TaxID=28002 RepID=A0ABP1J023_9EUKA
MSPLPTQIPVKLEQLDQNDYISYQQTLLAAVNELTIKIAECTAFQTQSASQQIEEFFESRPLYVMFEKELGCNPLTDHLSPKNVYSLFKFIIQDALNKIIDKSKATTFALVQNQLDEIIKQEIFKRIEAEHILEHYCLTNNIYQQYNQYLVKFIEDTGKKQNKTTTTLKQQVFTLKEQLNAKNSLFKADYIQQTQKSEQNDEKSEIVVQQQIIEQLMKENKKYVVQLSQLQKKFSDLQDKYNSLTQQNKDLKQQLQNMELNSKTTINQQQKLIQKLYDQIELAALDAQNVAKQHDMQMDKLTYEYDIKINSLEQELSKYKSQTPDILKPVTLEQVVQTDPERQSRRSIPYDVWYQELIDQRVKQAESKQEKLEQSEPKESIKVPNDIYDVEQQLLLASTNYQQLLYVGQNVQQLIDNLVEASVQTESVDEPEYTCKSLKRDKYHTTTSSNLDKAPEPLLVKHFQPSDATLGNIASNRANILIGQPVFQPQSIKSFMSQLQSQQEQMLQKKQQLIALVKNRYHPLKQLALALTKQKQSQTTKIGIKNIKFATFQFKENKLSDSQPIKISDLRTGEILEIYNDIFKAK